MTEIDAVTRVLGWVKDLTVTGAAGLFIYGGLRRAWLWWHHHEEVVDGWRERAESAERREDDANRREEWWQQYALSLVEVTRTAVTVAEKKVGSP